MKIILFGTGEIFRKYKMQIQKIIGRSKDYENLQSKRLQGHEQKGS